MIDNTEFYANVQVRDEMPMYREPAENKIGICVENVHVDWVGKERTRLRGSQSGRV